MIDDDSTLASSSRIDVSKELVQLEILTHPSSTSTTTTLLLSLVSRRQASRDSSNSENHPNDLVTTMLVDIIKLLDTFIICNEKPSKKVNRGKDKNLIFPKSNSLILSKERMM